MYSSSWKRRAVEALMLLLVMAFIAHVIWSWLGPLIPILTAFIVLAAVYAVLFRRH